MMKMMKMMTIAAALLPLVSATCTTEEDQVYLSTHSNLGVSTQPSYGECCDACILNGKCSYWVYNSSLSANNCVLKDSLAGIAKENGVWSGWAGNGPAPPIPQPAPPIGQWSAPILATSCADGKVLKDIPRISLAQCQATCTADPDCFFINHADQTDLRCMTFATCPSPSCRHGMKGWWTTYEYGRQGSPLWPGCTGPAPGPPPPAPPHDPSGIDCQIQLLALDYAEMVLDGANVSSVADSLALTGTACGQSRKRGFHSAKLADTLPPINSAAGSSYYVDGTNGADTNPGTMTQPWKTLASAQSKVRAMPKTANITVFVRQGTYFLSDTLYFGAEDGGSGSNAVVTWSNYNNEDVVISGGIDLSSLSWAKSTSNPMALEASLPTNAAGKIMSLFVNGRREIRAKFPNGDPLIPGGAGWSARARGATGSYPANGVQFPYNVDVNSTLGDVVSQGSSFSSTMESYTVQTPQYKYNPTRSNFYAYFNQSAERFNNTYNHPFWNSQVSPGFTTSALNHTWSNPSTGIVHMMHTGSWGGWQFQVAARPAEDTIAFACRDLATNKMSPCPASSDNRDLVIDGGFQECRGAAIGTNSFYVENIEEELDDGREWFMKSTSDTAATLMYIVNDTNPQSASVVGGVLKRLIVVENSAYLTLRGMTITHTAPTYMDSYECPSGGDWSVHRGAAVFIEDSTNVVVEGLTFDQPSGNAIMLSNAVNDSIIRKCSFKDVGDSAIVILGSTRLMLGMKGMGKFPTNNLIEANLVDTVGVYGKQTSAYFKGKADSNIVRNNVFMNGPRAGVNFNDGTAGGELLEGNLIFNFVRETGDHGMFNSWDRQPILRDDETGSLQINPKIHHITRNFIINKNYLGNTNSGYSIDHDDGSSMYNSTSNFLVYGAFKIRDGVTRYMAQNLIYGKPCDYQVAGFNSTTFAYNTVVASKITYDCVGTAFGAQGSSNSVHQHHNTYFTPNQTDMPFSACSMSFQQLKTAGYEEGSTISPNLTVTQFIDMAKTTLQMTA